MPLKLQKPTITGVFWFRGEKVALIFDGISDDDQGALKYIMNLGTRGEQFFDLSQDPGEKRNLVDERPAKVMDAKCLLKASGVTQDK